MKPSRSRLGKAQRIQINRPTSPVIARRAAPWQSSPASELTPGLPRYARSDRGSPVIARNEVTEFRPSLRETK